MPYLSTSHTLRPLDWKGQLALVLALAVTVRALFFVGFGLGDDLGYIHYSSLLLQGGYPHLELNQYAYRPLLLALFAGGIGLFGVTDFGVVVPVLAAALITTALVFVFVRRLVDQQAAWLCALLFALQPFNVVNSTTMTNDVILSCLILASYLAFLSGDREPDQPASMKRFVVAGVLMVAAFLVKITIMPALAALGLYSLWQLRARPAIVLRRHVAFYVTFAVGMLAVCVGYYLKTGDLWFQLRSEIGYYEAHKPTWYPENIPYWELMWQYPRSLFGVSGYGEWHYRDHGALFWLFVPASIWVISRRNATVLKFLVISTVVIFAFFQFYPHYVQPRYLPLVRQERYLEMLLPGAVIVVGAAVHNLLKRRPLVALVLLGAVLADFTFEAARRSFLFRDSQSDVRALSRFAASTVLPSGQSLSVDGPARNALLFYLKDVPVSVNEWTGGDLHEGYVAVGGARSAWWSRTHVYDPDASLLPADWVLAYQVPGQTRPWRPTPLRVYYVPDGTGQSQAIFAEPASDAPPIGPKGLCRTDYPAGFEGPAVLSGVVEQVFDIDNDTPLPAAHLEWAGWVRADSSLYTFETTSDDGSWIFVNERLLLDNGGVHPAKKATRTVRLEQGWYRFRLRYENRIAAKFLRFRVYKNRVPINATESTMFVCPTSESGAGTDRDRSKLKVP